MGLTNEDSDKDLALLQRARAGDAVAIAMLFEQQRPRLKKMMKFRMDPRLRARVDESDVLQDCWLDYTRRFPEFVQQSSMSFFRWLRFLTVQRLTDLHRKHLGALMRDAGQQVSLYQGIHPTASSVLLAEQLMGHLTSASNAAYRAELQIQVQEALNRLDEMDREVLVLRHFEMLTNSETAEMLGLKKAAASNRYLRALKRLKSMLSEIPGLLE